MLNWFSNACIVQARHAGSVYVNSTISMGVSEQMASSDSLPIQLEFCLYLG